MSTRNKWFVGLGGFVAAFMLLGLLGVLDEEDPTVEAAIESVTTTVAPATTAPATTVAPTTTKAPVTTVAPTTVAPTTTQAPPVDDFDTRYELLRMVSTHPNDLLNAADTYEVWVENGWTCAELLEDTTWLSLWLVAEDEMDKDPNSDQPLIIMLNAVYAWSAQCPDQIVAMSAVAWMNFPVGADDEIERWLLEADQMLN